jgi:AcrR family transcriptional regulator
MPVSRTTPGSRPSPESRPSKDEVLTAWRRSAILEAARNVFGDCGFDRATIERIARDAGVAKGTIYLYYSSKQSIYDDALCSGLAELDTLTRARIESAPTLQAAISAFISTRAEYFLERQGFFRMYVATVSGQITGGQSRYPEFRAMIQKQTRRLETIVARAVTRREIRRVDPEAIALAIFDLTRGLVARRLMAPGDANQTDLAGDVAILAQLIWIGLTPDRFVNRHTTKRRR